MLSHQGSIEIRRKEAKCNIPACKSLPRLGPPWLLPPHHVESTDTKLYRCIYHVVVRKPTHAALYSNCSTCGSSVWSVQENEQTFWRMLTCSRCLTWRRDKKVWSCLQFISAQLSRARRDAHFAMSFAAKMSRA